MAQNTADREAAHRQEQGAREPYRCARIIIPSKGVFGELKRLTDAMGELERRGYKVIWNTMDPESTSCSLPHIEVIDNMPPLKFASVGELEAFLRRREG